MNNMLDNCKYNVIKLIHELSLASWFINQCCHKDAKACKSKKCKDFFSEIQKDLEKIIEKLDKNYCNKH